MLKAITICGSLRRGSYNGALARALPALAPADLSIAPAPSWERFPVYNADEEDDDGFPGDVMALADAVRTADGVIIVTPEYNFSIPGGLKNALDWLSRVPNQPFKNKPVAIQSASGGPVGGARMQYHLRTSMVSVEALVLNKPEIFVGTAKTKFDEGLTLTDENTVKFVKQQLAAFVTLIRTVRGG